MRGTNKHQWRQNGIPTKQRDLHPKPKHVLMLFLVFMLCVIGVLPFIL